MAVSCLGSSPARWERGFALGPLGSPGGHGDHAVGQTRPGRSAAPSTEQFMNLPRPLVLQSFCCRICNSGWREKNRS